MSFFQNNNLSISELNSSILFNAAKTAYPMKNPGRKHNGLIYTFKGSEVYHFPNQTIRASENTVAFLPKNSRYFITLDDPCSSVITIDFELAAEPIHTPYVLPLPSGNPIAALFGECEKTWKNKKTAYIQECMSVYYKILALLIKQEDAVTHPASYLKIKESVKYLHEHYTEPGFRVEILSEISGMNPKYFYTLFSNQYGMSPKKYITALKIERAKEMLTEEKYSITEISDQLGYADIYHFSKTFKGIVCCTPTEYRSRTK